MLYATLPPEKYEIVSFVCKKTNDIEENITYNTCINNTGDYVSCKNENIIKEENIAYNTCMNNIGDNMSDFNKDIFTPSKEQLEAAKIRCEEKLKKGKSKGYDRHIRKVIEIFSDLRIDEY